MKDAKLTDFDEWCRAVGVHVGNDVSACADPRAAVAARFHAFMQWVATRRAHADEHGWPGGDFERRMQECVAYPGEPFDPNDL
ncbi:hypothetical protein [Mycolicibacterium litorale]|uniref:hypothetical protein n=1 Tax=Mycolicibacterium litorale TaxID=758802 RepID=UPI00162467C5|nr:hypothetical protein [Mycolicibacterium litorale]